MYSHTVSHPFVYSYLACNLHTVLYVLSVNCIYLIGHHRPCVAQAVSRWLSTAAARQSSMWGLWWTKRHWGRFSPSTSVSPANHFTNFSIVIITLGWHNRPINGCSADWTQLDSTPPLYQLKSIIDHHQGLVGIYEF
jgi:hypothetical protein